MSFTYSCIGNNTPENREHLEKLGYEEVDKLSCPCVSLMTSNEGRFFASPMSISYRSNVIRCIGNDQLFQAAAAMREDSDYMQWFTDGEHWFLCETTCFYPVLMKKDCYHKATLEELQEHFK